MLKKIFFLFFIIVFFLFFVYLGAAVIYSQQKGISLWTEIKIDSKNILWQIRDVIYHQGEIYNPKGDIIPDWIDDFIKDKINL